MKKRIVSVLSVIMVVIMFSLSTVTVFGVESSKSKNFTLGKSEGTSISIYAKKDTLVTINYDLGCNSASGTVCFDIGKQQWWSFYETVYVKSVNANTSGKLTFKVPENTQYNVSVRNNSENSSLVIGSYKVTYTEYHGGGGITF